MSRTANNTRTSRMRRAFGVAAVIIAAAAALFSGPAVVPQSSPVLAPVQAHATAGDTSVQVRAGGAVRAYCDWNVACTTCSRTGIPATTSARPTTTTPTA